MPRRLLLPVAISTDGERQLQERTIYITIGWGTVSAVKGVPFQRKRGTVSAVRGYRFSVENFPRELVIHKWNCSKNQWGYRFSGWFPGRNCKGVPFQRSD